MKIRRLIALIIAALMCIGTLPAAVFAEGSYVVSYPGLEEDESGNYLIQSEDDWNLLAAWVADSSEAYSFLQTADISVSVMLGTNDHPFTGVYDGGGHVLTVDLDGGSDQATAPFHHVRRATIRGLKVEGTVKGGWHSSGLVGRVVGTDDENDGPTEIVDCAVSVDVTSAGGYCGGIVGHGMDYETTVEGCVFNGTLTADHTGVIWGWSDGGSTARIVNCLDLTDKNQPVGTGDYKKTPVVSNTYYVTPTKTKDNVRGWDVKGTRAFTVTAGENAEAALVGVKEYKTSGITAGSTGLSYGGVIYAGSGESVALDLRYTGGGEAEPFTASSGTLSEDGDNYILAMTSPGQNVTVSAAATATEPEPEEGIEYLDPLSKTPIKCSEYTVYNGEEVLSDFVWYVADRNVTVNGRIKVDGIVNLILCDGVTVEALKGINVGPGCSLTVWAQSDAEKENSPAGALIATGSENEAGIGGDAGEDCGIVTINGGFVTAMCTGQNGYYTSPSRYAAGIGGGGGGYNASRGGDGGEITINGGKVTAACVAEDDRSAYGAGIGGGGAEYGEDGGDGGNVTINGGSVTAYCSAVGECSLMAEGAGIGGGEYGDGGNVTINGGSVTAYCFADGKNNTRAFGAGIGGGSRYTSGGDGGTVVINGGDVTAYCLAICDGGLAQAVGAGIGAGQAGLHASVTIRGGTVTAYSGSGSNGPTSTALIGRYPGTNYDLFIAPGMRVYQVPKAVEENYPLPIENRDKICTTGKYAKIVPCEDHQDENEDSVCDFCGMPVGGIHYVDPVNGGDPVCSEYTAYTGEAELTDGWYVVGPVRVAASERIEVSGSVNVILTDGATLDAKQGVSVPEGAGLTVWAQQGGTGALNAKAGELPGIAGIGGNECGAAGSVTINGGNVTAIGGENAAGIGGGLSGAGGAAVINAGTVTASAGSYALAIGNGFDEAYWFGESDEQLDPGTVTIATGLAASYGDGTDEMTPADESVTLDAREYACTFPKVKIEPCPEHDMTALGIPNDDGLTHTCICRWCLEPGDSENHVYSFYELVDDNTHVSYCDKCYEQSPLSEHVYVNHECECGAVQPAFSVTFNANGGKGTMDPQTVYDGEETALDANIFTRRGYSFAGWATEESGGGTGYADKAKVTLAANLELFAQWTPTPLLPDEIESGTFDGTDLTPEITVRSADEVLTAGEDYTVGITKDGEPVDAVVDAGDYLITVNGAGDFKDAAPATVTFTVEPKQITITAASREFTYDGTAQSCPEYTVEGLVGDDAISATVSGSVTFPGDTAENKIEEYEFTSGTPGNYSVSTESGELTMTAASAAITITAGSGSWTYDGSAHTNNEVTVTDGELFDGDRLVAETTGSVTNVADTEDGNNGIAPGYKIMHGDVDVTDNYSITPAAGTLTVTALSGVEVTITGHNAKAVYDGAQHTVTGYDVEISDPLYTADDFTFNGRSTAKRTNAGTAQMGLGEDQFTNRNTNFEGVKFKITDGYMTVTPKPVTVTAKSFEFTYNGEAQTCPEYTVEGLVGDDAIEATVSGSITFPGEGPVENKVTGYKFTSGTPGNYSVTTEDGELTMINASAAITITAGSGSWTYDGEEHTNGEVTVTDGELFDGDVLVAEAAGSVTNVADTTEGNNGIAPGYKIMHGDVDVTDNYVITLAAGTLTVEPKDVTVKADDVFKTVGADDPAFTATVTGLVNEGDKIEFSYIREDGDDVGVYTVTPEGEAEQGNYRVSYESGTLTVRPLCADGHTLVLTEAAEPTCTEPGNRAYYTCTVCGGYFAEDGETEIAPDSWVIPAAGHKPGAAVKENEHPATCTVDGSYDTVVYCTACGDEISRETTAIPATGHSYGAPDWEWETDYSAASAKFTCSKCGDVKVLNGDITSETTAPSCTVDGKTVYNAKVTLGEDDYRSTRTKILTAPGHKPGDPVKENETAPKCEETGSYDEVIYCTACEEELSRETVTVPAKGHAWGDWVETAPATCEEAGEEKRVCGNDPTHVETQPIPAKGHRWGDWIVTTEPTENEEGVETRYCQNDPTHFETRPVPTLSHVHNVSRVGANAPTCTEPGNSEYYVCESCGRLFTDPAGEHEISLEDTVIPAAGHRWGDWIVNVEPTEEAEGSENRTCSVCGAVETRSIPVLGHEHSLILTEAVPATCAEPGNIQYCVCTGCGRYFTDVAAEHEINLEDTVIPALGHNWGMWFTVRPATEYHSGLQERICLNDVDHVQTHVIPQLPHTDCPCAQFADVSTDDWYHEDLDFVIADAFMMGVTPWSPIPDKGGAATYTADPAPAGLFDPEGVMTRAMAVVVLWRVEGKPDAVRSAFGDVEAGSWYEAAVNWAASCGIVLGVSADRFDPNAPITREQAAAIWYRYAKYKGVDVSVSSRLDQRFTDANRVDDWAYDALAWMSETQLVIGVGGDRLAPKDATLRCQFAAMTHRFCVGILGMPDVGEISYGDENPIPD